MHTYKSRVLGKNQNHQQVPAHVSATANLESHGWKVVFRNGRGLWLIQPPIGANNCNRVPDQRFKHPGHLISARGTLWPVASALTVLEEFTVFWHLY